MAVVDRTRKGGLLITVDSRSNGLLDRKFSNPILFQVLHRKKVVFRVNFLAITDQILWSGSPF
jgi:hypothetical protein